MATTSGAARSAGHQGHVIKVADFTRWIGWHRDLRGHDQGSGRARRGFVRATLKGAQDVIANPDEVFQAALEVIPELKSADARPRIRNEKCCKRTLP